MPSLSGKLNPANASYIIENLNFGIMQAQASKKNALVTGPISKQNIIDSGIKFSGHTEWIQEKTKSKDVLMLLSAKQLRVALVTTHIPLIKVAESITKKKVIAKAIILNEDLKLKLKVKAPRLIMLGLNPHAGEGGTIGSEESLILKPAAEYLRKQRIVLSPIE